MDAEGGKVARWHDGKRKESDKRSVSACQDLGLGANNKKWASSDHRG